MKKYWIVFIFAVGFIITSYGQNFLTKDGIVRFSSETRKMKTEAVNHQVSTALLASTGDFFIKLPVQSFVFDNTEMQVHFITDYLEADKYPEVTFLGKVTNIREIDFSKDSIYPSKVEGKLTIHGQTQHIKQDGTFEVRKGTVTAKANFSLLLSDYNIKISEADADKISNTISVTVEVMMPEMRK